MTRNCLEIKLKAPQSAVDEQLHASFEPVRHLTMAGLLSVPACLGRL
jgi:hypothetical protein